MRPANALFGNLDWPLSEKSTSQAVGTTHFSFDMSEDFTDMPSGSSDLVFTRTLSI
jgi:hypothetical protein